MNQHVHTDIFHSSVKMNLERFLMTGRFILKQLDYVFSIRDSLQNGKTTYFILLAPPLHHQLMVVLLTKSAEPSNKNFINAI